jgi:hypothetical protein
MTNPATEPLTIPAAVLDGAREFFEECGSRGCEGTAMIAAAPDGVRLVIPDQRATPAPYCSVEVTLQGKLELAGALRPGEVYVSRIHSHPELPFHSATDNRNPALTHDGALSIVAPYFGLGLRQSFDCCAVYVRRNHQWVELPPGPDRDQVVVVR